MRKVVAAVKTYFSQAYIPFILLCVLASVYGVMLVYSVAKTAGSGTGGYIIQLCASAVGLVLALIIARIDYELIGALWPLYTGLAMLLILLTYTPLGLNATGTDDTAWLGITLGSQLITFQPSELLKIVFIVTFSKHLCHVQDRMDEPLQVLLLCVHGAVPALMVFKQGDDGTALVFVCIFFAMMLASRLPKIYYAVAGGALALAIPLLWVFFLDDDKKARFLCLFQIAEHLDGAGWQQYYGLMALGSGRLTGLGYTEGGRLGLFARNNDFIFTVAGEEFGYIGALVLLAILFLILLCIYHAARTARDPFGSFICIGMLGYLGFQTVINLGMVTRMLPVIGITLPFFSAGGSSVATMYLGIGLVMSVYYHSRGRDKHTIFSRSYT